MVLLFKTLFTFSGSLRFLVFLLLLSSFDITTSISSLTSSQSSKATIQEEAKAPLTWKANLHNQTAYLLHSWANSSSTTCSWSGISCNRFGRVVEIRLTSLGLSGTLHTFHFSSFPYLVSFNLNDNHLFDTIPVHIGNLFRLNLLSLRGNQFSGRVPFDILGNLKSLKASVLDNNNFTDPIPPSIRNLSDLTILHLYWNQFSGLIPSTIANLKSLVELALSFNNLNGAIPSSIGNLSDLNTLHLSRNQLYGPIPLEIGNLKQLVDLELSHNTLSGPVPYFFGNLTDLTTLYLHSNQLSGPIPSEIGNLKHLVESTLSENTLTGPIPYSFSNLTDLITLYLYSNKLSGGRGLTDDLSAEAMMMDALDKVEKQLKKPLMRSDAKGMDLLQAEFDKIKKKLGIRKEDLPKYEEQLEVKIAKAQLQELKKEVTEAMDTQKKREEFKDEEMADPKSLDIRNFI